MRPSNTDCWFSGNFINLLKRKASTQERIKMKADMGMSQTDGLQSSWYMAGPWNKESKMARLATE